MELDDPRWSQLRGAYGRLYDPRAAVRRLLDGDTSAWDELWEDLYHQGEVGEASYAALPLLVTAHEGLAGDEWNAYALAATIEIARHDKRNPAVPDWLLASYQRGWQELESFALRDFQTAAGEDLVDSIIAVLALARQRYTLGRMAMLSEDERGELLGLAGWG